MKIKLLQIMESRDALTRLASEKYPANIAYRIQRNIRSLEPEATGYIRTRDDLIRNKYGVEIDAKDKPGVYKVLPEKAGEYTEEIGLLLNEEVDVNIMTIPLDSLHEISPLDLMALEWMFEAPIPVTEEMPAGTYHESHRVRQGNNRGKS